MAALERPTSRWGESHARRLKPASGMENRLKPGCQTPRYPVMQCVLCLINAGRFISGANRALSLSKGTQLRQAQRTRLSQTEAHPGGREPRARWVRIAAFCAMLEVQHAAVARCAAASSVPAGGASHQPLAATDFDHWIGIRPRWLLAWAFCFLLALLLFSWMEVENDLDQMVCRIDNR